MAGSVEHFPAIVRRSGAGNETRTRDLNLGKVALYQLSYSRVEAVSIPKIRRPPDGGLKNLRPGGRRDPLVLSASPPAVSSPAPPGRRAAALHRAAPWAGAPAPPPAPGRST